MAFHSQKISTGLARQSLREVRSRPRHVLFYLVHVSRVIRVVVSLRQSSVILLENERKLGATTVSFFFFTAVVDALGYDFSPTVGTFMRRLVILV